MNKIPIIVLCWAVPFFASGQKLSRQEIVGIWVSREVSIATPVREAQVENAAIQKAKQGLLNARFIFKPNGIFLIQLPVTAPSEFRELELMNNKMWHIRSKEQMVFVGSLDEDLLTIDVKTQNGFYYFLVADTPLVLKMERIR